MLTTAAHMLSCALDPKTHHYLCALTGNGLAAFGLLVALATTTLILVGLSLFAVGDVITKLNKD